MQKLLIWCIFKKHFYWYFIDIIQHFFKKIEFVTRYLQESGSLLTAHILMHMEPKDAQCDSDHALYTGAEGWPFDGWERVCYNK